MKKIIMILAIGCMSMGYSQVPNTNPTNSQNGNIEVVTHNYNAREATYRNGDQNYDFEPDNNGYSVLQEENGTISTVGKLRKTVNDDDYYILHSTNGSRNSIGRFDRDGNFRAYRYDPSQDRIIEDEYIKNVSDRNRRTRTNKNVQENMNTDEGIQTPGTRKQDLNTNP